MTHQVTVTADLGDEYPITGSGDLSRVLTELAASDRVQHPVVIVAVDDAEMMIGVHRNRGVLYWNTYSEHDAVAIKGTNERPVLYGANEMLMPPYTELPLRTVIGAAEQFVRTGQRPTSARWTWVSYDAAMQTSHHRVAS